jgi:hypothetical protein
MKSNKSLESCVYYFFNEYENNNRKEKIHKIVKLDFWIQNELTNQKKIIKISDWRKYYYMCDYMSKLKITEINEETMNIRSNKLDNDDTILLEFKNRKTIYLKTYLKSLSSTTKYLLSIINFYKHILNSISLLVNKNIVHNHITFDSIIVDNNDYPLLSNFSFSIDFLRADINKYIKHFILTYDPTYIEWPLELHLLSYLITNKLNSLSLNNIESVIHDVIENNAILKTFGDSVVGSYKIEANNYFKKYVNQSYDCILTDLLQYTHTWDNYALSILFLRILIGIHRSIGIQNKFIILFMKLLVNNIHLNPCKRFTIDLTMHQFDSILDSLEPKDYKDIINNLTSA